MIIRIDRIVFGLLFFVLAMSSAQQQAKAHEPLALSGQEILTQVIGNTASGVGKKHNWSEYYNPDGTIEGRTDGNADESNDGPYQGKWTISGSEMCFVYADSEDQGCVTISVNEKGDEITYSQEGADHSSTGTLLKGNPKNY